MPKYGNAENHTEINFSCNTMRRFLSLLMSALLGLTLSMPVAANPDPGMVTYNVDASHSRIAFQVRHLGISKVTGSFGDYEVDLRMDPTDITTLSASTAIKVESISTGVERRDGHLKSEDFFAAEAFPEMTFETTEVRPLADDRFELVGNLTIRDNTRPVTLTGEMVGPVVGPMGQQRIAFEAEGSISRADYGLTWNKLTEAGGIIVADEVDILLEIQAVQETVGS